MDEEERTTCSVVTCPTCLECEVVLIVLSTEPFEVLPWCEKCKDVVGPVMKPAHDFTWLHHHNRQ